MHIGQTEVRDSQDNNFLNLADIINQDDFEADASLNDDDEDSTLGFKVSVEFVHDVKAQTAVQSTKAEEVSKSDHLMSKSS